MSIQMIEPDEAQAAKVPSTELTVPQRAAVALNSTKTRTDLTEMVKKSAAIVEIKNEAGRQECHAAAMVLVRTRTSIEKVGKAARDDATRFQKAVIAEEASLISITTNEEKRLLALRDKWDADRAAEKAEAERKERERVAAIGARIANITALALLAADCRTSAKVAELIGKAETTVVLDEATFAEFLPEAIAAHDKSLAQMRAVHQLRLGAEAERKRLDDERADLERARVERAAEEKRQAEQRAELAAQQKRLDDERAALEAQRVAALRPVAVAPQPPAPAEAEQEQAAHGVSADEKVAVQACRPEDRAMLETDAGKALVAGAVAALGDHGPTDAEIVGRAVDAVSAFFAMTEEEALRRLGAIQGWQSYY